MLHFLGGISPGRALQALSGQINVLQVFQMLENRFTGVESLGAPGSFGQALQAAFDVGIESNGERKATLSKLYVYSKEERTPTPTFRGIHKLANKPPVEPQLPPKSAPFPPPPT